MSDNFSWSTSFGRWKGVGLEIHLFFWLFAASVFAVEWQYLASPGTVWGTGLATVVLVFSLAVFHELAHAWVAVCLGGTMRTLVITPWGGNSTFLMPPHPKAHLAVHAAGPVFHLALFAVGAFLLISTQHATLWDLTNPLRPLPLQGGLVEISLIKIATWLNFQMLIVNLIPVSPFDGREIVSSLVQSGNPEVSDLKLETALLSIGLLSGCAAFLIAWFVREVPSAPLPPAWFLMTVAGVLLIFSARNRFHQWASQIQLEDFSMLDELMEYEGLSADFPDGGPEPFDHESELLHDWMADQYSGSEKAEQSVALEEERRVDTILEKLHRLGLDGLSEDERSFLNRISQQYRRRRGES